MWNETLVEPGLSLFVYFKSAKSTEVNEFPLKQNCVVSSSLLTNYSIDCIICLKKCIKKVGLLATYFCIGASSSPVSQTEVEQVSMT